MSAITPILNQIRSGESCSSELLPLIYTELRRLASHKLRGAPPGETLQPTALVHEAFLRLAGTGESRDWDNRAHFFAAAATAMRNILVENARRRRSIKHGGGQTQRELTNYESAAEVSKLDELLDLDSALSRLAESDPDLARLVELRYFAGLTVEETADVLGISPRTVKRNWSFARAWLGRELGSSADAGE